MNSETRKDPTKKIRTDNPTLRLLDQTRFNESDWSLFLDSLDTSSEPTERMKKAAQRYSQIVNSEGI